MGALATTKLQANFNIGRTLINVYADDETELEQLLAGLSEKAAKIASTESVLNAVGNVSTVLGGQSLPHDIQSAQGGNSTNGRPEGVDPQFCSHGEMTYTSGVSRAGNNYAVFNCVQKVCDAKWPPRKRG